MDAFGESNQFIDHLENEEEVGMGAQGEAARRGIFSFITLLVNLVSH